MAVAANKRSVMTLYSDASDIYSHQVRIVLAEKVLVLKLSWLIQTTCLKIYWT